jgi:hypothetical protein
VAAGACELRRSRKSREAFACQHMCSAVLCASIHHCAGHVASAAALAPDLKHPDTSDMHVACLQCSAHPRSGNNIVLTGTPMVSYLPTAIRLFRVVRRQRTCSARKPRVATLPCTAAQTSRHEGKASGGGCLLNCCAV